MRFIQITVILTILAVIVFYVMEGKDAPGEKLITESVRITKEKSTLLKAKEGTPNMQKEIPLEGDLFQWVGKGTDQLQEQFGEPKRKDPSAYDYTWWVYTDDSSQYIQFGVLGEEVKTIYATGSELGSKPFVINQTYDEINKKYPFEEHVNYSENFASYTFKLNEDDLKMRPLIKVDDDIFVQAYFDTFTEKLSSIRVLTADILLLHRPYELEYRGQIPERPILNNRQWLKIEEGMERQIFEITNVLRHQYNKSVLKWDESVSQVALKHSKDMEVNKYFSHYSQNGNGLKERLAEKEVFYTAAGENIAAQYPDAPAAIEGWLNSEGHRQALLKEEYTHLGVGVYRLYFTQNFLAKPL
ncbi:CAP domain-containing protein [Virgibacillus halodenitrificans]|uniref:CAP domain-containing protein n=1 Tax=Virgibacillus halodenitrificans TaxID=1482 RepID=UPI000762114A